MRRLGVDRLWKRNGRITDEAARWHVRTTTAAAPR
jgi:hypothetical protein